MNNIVIPQTIPEKLLYTTVRIVGTVNKEANSVATGCFFRTHLNDSDPIEMILTNKHVLENSKGLTFFFHEAEINLQGERLPSGRSFSVEVEQYSDWWIPHPNEAVDLGAISFQPIQQIIKEKIKRPIYYQALDQSLIKTDEELINTTSVVEDILMVGCPVGLWDDHNNFPMFRKGITATHPAVDFQNRSIGVVDVTCFRGSSGSPILTFDRSSKEQPRSIFLGVLSTGPSYINGTEIILKPLSTIWKPLSLNEQMIHLGFYVKAKEILKLVTR